MCIEVIQYCLSHPSSTVKERILQTLLLLPPSIVLQFATSLIQSVEQETRYSVLFDLKLRVLTRLESSLSCSQSFFKHVMKVVQKDLLQQNSHSLLHILQFFSAFTDGVVTEVKDVVAMTAFYLSCDEVVVRTLIQLLTKICRFLAIPEICQILKVVKKEQVDHEILFPFYFAILQYHAADCFSEEVEDCFVEFVIAACKDMTNVELFEIIDK